MSGYLIVWYKLIKSPKLEIILKKERVMPINLKCTALC